MTSPDRQPQSRLTGRARDGGAPAPVVLPHLTRTMAVNSTNSVFVYLGTRAPHYQPYMLPSFPWRLELAHGYPLVAHTAP